MHAGDATEAITKAALHEPVASETPEDIFHHEKGTATGVFGAPAEPTAPELSAPRAMPPPKGTPERTSFEGAQWISALQSAEDIKGPVWQEEKAPGQLPPQDSGVEAAGQAEAAEEAQTAPEATGEGYRAGEPITAGTERITREFL